MRTIQIVFVGAVTGAAVVAFACSDYGEDDGVKPINNTPDSAPPSSPPQQQDGGDATPLPTPPRDVPALVSAQASAVCAYYARCVPGLLKLFFGDEAACRTRDAQLWTALFSAPGATFGRPELDACIAKLATVDCYESGAAPVLSECTFVGSLDDGAPCDGALQCKSRGCFHPKVDGGGPANCGQCKAPVGENADCSQADCEPSLTCISNKCVKYAEPFAACSASAPCKGSHICVGGKCERPLALGASCTIGGPTPPHPCDSFSGLFCQPSAAGSSTGTCAPMTFAVAGQTCGFTTATTLVQCTNSSCVAPPATFTGTCTAYLNDNANCSPSLEAGACALPSTCNEGKCGLRRCK